MHSALTIGDSVVMATDGMVSGKAKFDGVSLTINADSDSEAKKYFNNLAEGGEVTMPLNKTFFASSFGMLKDKFGVHWMVIAGSTPQQ
jgi:PhnB protein